MSDDKIKNAKHGKHARPAGASQTSDNEKIKTKDTSGFDIIVTKPDEPQDDSATKQKADEAVNDASSNMASSGEQIAPIKAHTAVMPNVVPQNGHRIEESRIPAVTPTGSSNQNQPDATQPAQVSYGMTPYGAVAPSQGMNPVDMAKVLKARRRKRSVLKALGITCGVMVGLVLIAYVGVAVYFSDRFMPNSTIGEVNVSLMNASEAQRAIANSVSGYNLVIEGEGFTLDLSATDAGLRVNAASMVEEALAHENAWLWPLELRREHNETAAMAATYNNAGLTRVIEGAVADYNATVEAPTNASVGYDTASKSYVVTPESTGQALEAAKVIEAADKALAVMAPSVQIGEDALLQPEVRSDDERLVNAAAEANKMIAADITLMMGDTTVGTVDGDLIHQWVTLDDELVATLDRDALTSWVDNLAGSLNTVGTSRTYERPDGKTFTVSGGVYGWEVDRDALLERVTSGVDNGTIETVEVPTVSSGTAFNGVGERDWGNRYLDIDLAEQHVYLYDENKEVIWESDCISGEPDGVHDTSTGVFWVNAKQSPSKLIGYENGEKIYESTVQYWMPFDGNAIGLHDADWQPDFGGTMYKEGYGSHGCVNLPPDKAAELYGLLQEGDVVVSHW